MVDAKEAEAAAARQVREVVRELRTLGLSLADIAYLTDVSRGRVSAAPDLSRPGARAHSTSSSAARDRRLDRPVFRGVGRCGSAASPAVWLDGRVSTLVRVLDGLNRAHPWSHNDAYGGFVMRQASKARREGGSSALDIGCGTGNLLARLGRRFTNVVGIEADPATAAQAAAAVASMPSASVVRATFPVGDGRKYDFVSMVAVLHHLPLVSGIAAVRDAVAPGGRLAIVGLYREEPNDALYSLASLLLNPLVGIVVHPRPSVRLPSNMCAPTAEATDTYRAIREALRARLPGVRVHRGLFWRYTATWRAPR